MSLLGLKSNLNIIDENVYLDPNDNSNNKLAYDSNPPSMVEELPEDDLKRKAYQQNECKVFNMRQIQSFIAFCCNQLTQQLEGWKTSESC